MIVLKHKAKYDGRWYEAEKCYHPDLIEPYYLIAGHIFLETDLEEIKVERIKIKR